MPEFVPGLDLAAGFYADVVAPLVAAPHAAALIGAGSDVLGYDTARSTDHDWGPRLQLFLAAADVEPVLRRVEAGLPETYRGWPTRFGSDRNPVHHGVVCTTLPEFVCDRVGAEPPLPVPQWVAVAPQRLLEIVAGRVFHDPAGELTRARSLLAYYPRPVWLWLMARQWQRLEHEEAFVGRASELGDLLGARLVAAGQVRALMCLAFLQERTYWPYTKWFGTAFSRLAVAGELAPLLPGCLDAAESALVAAYELLARRHNALAVTPELDPATRPFHDRPYRVLGADRFAAACLAEVDNQWLREQPLLEPTHSC